jgi:hypothetical protein
MVEKVFVATLELRIPFDNVELSRLGGWIDTGGLREGGPGLGVERHSREVWLARSNVVGQGVCDYWQTYLGAEIMEMIAQQF